MRIGIIGAGRLGICFALLCEEAGHSVFVSDVVSKYVTNINNKEIKILFRILQSGACAWFDGRNLIPWQLRSSVIVV